MADKRDVKKNIKWLEHVKTWQLLILLLLAVLLTATFLRLNNVGMVERRQGVLSADKAGNVEDIQNRLYDLQRYSSSHMNASTGRIALQHQFERDSQKAKEVAEANNQTGNVYKKAAEVCDPIGIAQGWRWPDPRYIACIDDELSKYPAGTDPGSGLKLPNINLYYHSFISPIWSPDFAGFSVLLCGLLILLTVIRLIALGILQLLLKQHYRSL